MKSSFKANVPQGETSKLQNSDLIKVWDWAINNELNLAQEKLKGWKYIYKKERVPVVGAEEITY